MSMSPELKARVLGAAKQEAGPTRAAVHARTWAVIAATVLLDLAIFFFWMGGVHLGDPRYDVPDRPLTFVCGTVIGWSLISAAAAWLAFSRSGSMLGRGRGALLVVALLTPLVLFGWMLLFNVQYPETFLYVPQRPGLRCLSYTLVLAALPLVALAYVRRERNPETPGATGAARGVALGALAGILVDLWCPVTGPAHVLIGHISPLLILMALGALVGRVLGGVHVKTDRRR